MRCPKTGNKTIEVSFPTLPFKRWQGKKGLEDAETRDLPTFSANTRWAKAFFLFLLTNKFVQPTSDHHRSSIGYY